MALESPITFSSYVDLDDFKSWLNQVHITGRDDELALTLDFACEWVQDYIHGPIPPTSVTEIRDGSSAGGPDGSSLMVSYTPIIQVTSVIEGRGTNGQVTLTESTPSYTAQDGYQVDYLYGRIIRSFGSQYTRPWFPGSRNIVFTYIAGYDPMPAKLRLATLEFAKYTWLRSQDARTGGASRTVDPASLLYPGVPDRLSDMLEAYKEIVVS